MAIRDHLPTPPSPPAPSNPIKKEDNRPEDETTLERIYEGTAEESTESPVRYAAYAARFRTILSATHRYVAYTSDIGESFRPVAHPYAVKAAYGISWLYLTGDVAYEGYKAYLSNQQTKLQHLSSSSSSTKPIPLIEDYRTIMVQRAIFQTLASMALPAFTIHSVVRYSGRAMKSVKNPRLRTWGPVGLGLAVVPGLPYLFDEPVERAVEWVFHRASDALGKGKAEGHAQEKEKEKERLREKKDL